MVLQKDITVKIPVGIKEDLKIILLQNPPSFNYIFDNFVFILSKIFMIPARSTKYRTRLVPIYSKIIKSEIGDNYKKYLKWLTDNNFLISDNWYCKKRAKSKCYGYTEGYYKRNYESYKITKKSLIKRHMNWYFKRNTNSGKELRENLKNLEFDYESAALDLEIMRSKRQINKKDYEMLKYKYEEIRLSKIYGHRDNYGRFHSNYTQINKFSRKYIKADGEQLVEIDIQSCQVGLLYSLIYKLLEDVKQNRYDDARRFGNDVVRRMSGDFRDKYLSKYGNNYYDGEKVSEIGVSKNLNELDYDNDFFCVIVEKELEKFKKILKKDFYKWIAKESKKYTKITVNRMKAKKMFFKKIFGRKCNEGYLIKIFENEFPMLLKIINYLKKDNYKELARTLQREESTLIIDKLSKWLIEEKGIRNFYTVHDCIGIQEKHKMMVTWKLYELMYLNNIPVEIKVEQL
jgi:hypothetical protein